MSRPLRVPFIDLVELHREVLPAVRVELERVFESGAFVNGPAVQRFERAFAEFCEAGHCVAVSSGLDALVVGLRALGVVPGDEVIVPANTFIATFEAVSIVGATPVPVDASPTDYNIDVEKAADAVTARTTAIVPVHLFGQMADMQAVNDLARAAGLAVIEDACQAHGATRDGLKVGAAGDAAAFSFYPGKNLGAMGDAGALTTNHAHTAAECVALREHGQARKYEHHTIGYTARMDTLQACVLTIKLELLEAWNQQRQAIAKLYSSNLHGVGDLGLPAVISTGSHVFHVYAVTTHRPDDLSCFLQRRGVQTGRHYPTPPHLSAAYANLGFGPGSFPTAENLAEHSLSLPIHPTMSKADAYYVIDMIQRYFHESLSDK